MLLGTTPHTRVILWSGPQSGGGGVACALSLELELFNFTCFFRFLNHMKTLECKLQGPPSYIFNVYKCPTHSRPSTNTWVWAHLPPHAALSPQVSKADCKLPSSYSWVPIRTSSPGLGGRRPSEKPFLAPSQVWRFLRCSAAMAMVKWKGQQKNLGFVGTMTYLLCVLVASNLTSLSFRCLICYVVMIGKPHMTFGGVEWDNGCKMPGK